VVERLPERERLVIGMYYQEELTLKEIGEVLGVTESRVCQIHSQAIARLRGFAAREFSVSVPR
jgi:RNA polymerase sigma factor for flagellar operon FliA